MRGKQQRSSKTPYYVYLKSGESCALAGLMGYVDKAEWSVLVSFTIITTESNDSMHGYTKRMPLILHRDDEDQWFGAPRMLSTGFNCL